MILVTGASGTTGSEVVHRLVAAGARVRAFLRNPQKRLQFDHPAVEVVWGDFDKPPTLDEAMAGVGKVFLLSSPDPRQVEFQGNVIDAAKRAGSVRHIVKMSALGAASDSPVHMGRWHAETERYLEASGIAWTHLRPHFFMQNLFVHAQEVALEGVLRAPMGGGRMALIDARDVAAAAAAILVNGGHEGQAYELTGPEALSYKDIAQKVSAAIGAPVQYLSVTADEERKRLRDALAPEWFADDMVALYGGFRAGHGEAVTDAVQQLTGRPARSFDEFVQEHAHKFRERG